MTKNLIVAQNGDRAKLPRAIAREKNGIVMYWVDELEEGGLHLKGLARLVDYSHGSLSTLVRGVEGIEFLEAEILTESGVKMVELLTGKSIAKVLRHLTRPGSKVAVSVQERANDFRDQLAMAGFKLAVMLELAPEKLATQAIAHTQTDKEIRLQELKLQTAQLVGDLSTLHGKELAMAAIGMSDCVVKVETVVTEIVNPATRTTDKILSADQLKRAVAGRTGQKLKTMAAAVDKLRAKGRDDLLVAVTRHQTSQYIKADRLDEALEVLYGQERQELIKPIALQSNCFDT